MMPGATGRGRFYASSIPRDLVNGEERRAQRAPTTSDSQTITASAMQVLREAWTKLSAFASQGVLYTRSRFFASRTSSVANTRSDGLVSGGPQIDGEGPNATAASSTSRDNLTDTSHDAISGRRAQIAFIIAMPSPHRHTQTPPSTKLKDCASSDKELFPCDRPPVCEIGIVTTRISSQAKTPVSVDGD